MACAIIRRQDDNIFLMEASTGLIHQLDGRGHYRGRLGPPTHPGAQESSCVFAGWSGDKIWVYDAPGARIEIVDPQTQRTSELPVWFAPLSGTGPGRPRAALQSGHWLVEYMPPVAGPGGPASVELVVTRNVLNASPSDTLARLVNRHGVLTLVRGDTIMSMAFQPFSDDPLAGFSSHGDLLVLLDRRLNGTMTAQQFAVTVTGRTGVLSRWSHSRSLPPLDEATISAFIGPRAADLARRGLQTDSVQAYQWYRSSIYLPLVPPAVDGLVVGRDTTIWVRWFRPNESEVQTWTGFSLAGDSVATTRAPFDFRPFEASRTGLWGLVPTSPSQEADILRVMATVR